jgi:serine/threonine-protein kinase
VYRATDTALDRVVALKVLHPQLMVDESFITRFKKEARLLASLDHPNIITIFDLGEVEARIFLAMRYLPGGNLEQMLQKKGPLPWNKVIEIMQQVCDGLGSAHQQNLVHRDIKPANILFDARGNAVISDFGLARAVQLSGTTSSMNSVGTPAYRAPELWRGKPPATPATDIYSLGCVLTETLTGVTLFTGETPDEILTLHLIDGPKLPQTWPAGVPSGVSAVISKSLSRDPIKRHQGATEFLMELSELNRPKPAPIPKAKSEKEPASSRANEMSIQVFPGVRMEFVKVPAGEFVMGSDPASDPNASPDEQPAHKVYLDEYWIGMCPVTNEQYLAYLGQTGVKDMKISAGKALHPVTNISWKEADRFCEWLTKKVKQNIFLPTEAQWEKAARGTDRRIYPWGNEPPKSNLANFGFQVGDTSAVGNYPEGASIYGALDMAGNVWEWVADWYGNKNYSFSPAQNPPGVDIEYRKVLRGGSWTDNAVNLRLACRFKGDPAIHNTSVGFRCALSIKHEESKPDKKSMLGLMSEWA